MNQNSTHACTDESPVITDEAKIDAVWQFIEKSSWSAGSIRGVPIRIHFLIILAIYLWFFSTHSSGIDHTFTVKCITFITFLGIMLAHEMGHAIVARYFGDYVKGIVLMPPIGAAAFILLNPAKPLARIAICIAGPLINIITALLIFLLREHFISGFYPPIYLSAFLRFLWMSSLVLGVFNLLPLFPMDGGRILRDVLLLCKVSDRMSNLMTLLVSFLCFIVLGYLSVKESAFYMLFIITIMILLAVAELAFGKDKRLQEKAEL